MATLNELTGGLEDKKADGISFLPELLGKGEQKKHKFLYFEYPEKNGQLAIRLGNWKAVKTNLKNEPKARWQLYDLSTDVAETTNLADKHPRLLRKFSRIMKREHQHSDVLEWEIIDQ